MAGQVESASGPGRWQRVLYVMPDAIFETNLPLPNRKRGKVRDLYDLPGEPGQPPRLLMVATDRLSAYDVVMPTPFPGKGLALTEISSRWFTWIASQGLADHHLLSLNVDGLGLDADQRRMLEGRTMVCRKTRVVPIECVARGYLAGSGWKEYQRTGAVCGVALPEGLRQCDRLPEPIFTPSTKAEVGHDENISFDRAAELVGRELVPRLRDVTLSIYSAAAAYALERGIIIADTKFEFGFALNEGGEPTDELILIDEALTPDSSRFWPAEEYEPGRDQQSFDKQYVRNYLLELVAAGKWAKQPPGPALPDDVVANTMARYVEAKRRLFGDDESQP